MSPCPYHVAVDFGSESMAACYIEPHMLEPQDIDLQARAKAIVPSFEPLLEEDGAVSKRLRTRIALVSKTQVIDEARLQQQLQVPLDKSDFAYFHEPYQEYARDLLPNLKLMYQAAITSLLPASVTARPEQLLPTIIVQILSGIVFQDGAFLQHAKAHAGKLTGSMIHLLLTIPNVYSISHASKLRRFVSEHLQVGGEKLAEVETIYESDAIAHFLMWKRPTPPQSIASAVRRIRVATETGKRFNLATIDIGRGTTDVSFSTFEGRADGGWDYDLKARTGRAHGGGRLTYLIAEAIGDALAGAFTKAAEGAPEPVQKVLKEHHIRLTRRSAGGLKSDATIIAAAEEYIEAIKRNWDENLHLSNAAAVYAKIDPILKQFEGMLKGQIPDEVIKRLLPLLAEAFRIPENLPGAVTPGFWKSLLGSKTPEPGGNRAFATLRGKVDQYVASNTDDVVSWMEEMVRANEKESRTHFGSLLKNSETIVLIAGQAGQFPPLREALKSRVRSWDLDDETDGNIVFLKGQEAKYACCHGAVMRHRLPVTNLRPRSVMGTYGFLSQVVGGGLMLVDMTKFQIEKEAQTVVLTKKAFHSFVFAPRHFAGKAIKGDTLDILLAGGDALAYLWPISEGGGVTVTNLGDRGIELVYEDDAKQKTEVRDDAAFGDVIIPGEDIYTRTWPEVLKPLD